MSNWTPTGVVYFDPFFFEPEQQKQVDFELKKFKVEINNPKKRNEFFSELEHAMSGYLGGTRLRNENKPSTIRANLKNLKNAIHTVNDKLNKLDGNSRDLIAKQLPYPFLDMREHITTMFYSISEAQNIADEYPKKGALQDHPRFQLALDTVTTLHKYTDITPTLSKEGLYESVLTVVLSLVTNEEYTGLHALLSKAINSYRESPSN